MTSDPVSAPPDGPGVEAGVDRVRAMLSVGGAGDLDRARELIKG